MELGISAKAFCNYYYNFYLANQPYQIFHLLKYKNMTSAVNFVIPFSPKHTTHLNITTHNDLNKGLGQNIFRIIQQYNYSNTFNARLRLLFKDKERGIGFDFIKWFCNR